MKQTFFIVFLLAFALSFPHFAYAQQKLVPINPFTSEVRESLNKVKQDVSNVERNISPNAAKLEESMQDYDACKNKEDQGCVDMAKDVKTQYLQILKALDNKLPSIRENLSVSSSQLGKEWNKQTRNKSIKDIYSNNVRKKSQMPKLRGPLSKRLTQLADVFKKPFGNISLAEIAINTQADLMSSVEIIDFVETQISYQITMLETIDDMAIISPEIVKVMSKVQDVLDIETEFPYYDVSIDSEEATDNWSY